jgi:hypothetical protein
MSAARDRTITGVGWLPYAPNTLESLAQRFNGLISLGDGSNFGWAGNLDGQTLTFTTPAVANTVFEIPHGLGRIPTGWLEVYRDRAAQLYDGSNKLSWTEGSIFWACNTASAVITVIVF